MAQKMNLTESQCRPKLVTILDRNPFTQEYEECEGRQHYKLAHLGITNGRVHRLTVRFDRWAAFRTKKQRLDILERLEREVGSLYPRELQEMAFNIAPNYDFD